MNQTINQIMERASQSLAKMDYLAGERDCLEALALARQSGDWNLYAAIILPLQECRRQRRMIAADGWVLLGTQSIDDLASLVSRGPGCVLVTQPHHSMHAKRLVDHVLTQQQYMEILFADSDPAHDTWTLLAPAGPMVVLDMPAPPAAWRNRFLSPDEPWPGKQPAKGVPPRPGDWFIDATEALGDAALAKVKAPLGSLERITQLEAALQVVMDHEFLHQALAQAARAMVKAPC